MADKNEVKRLDSTGAVIKQYTVMGEDFFFALNQGWIHDEEDLRFRPADSKVSAKFQYTFRF